MRSSWIVRRLTRTLSSALCSGGYARGVRAAGLFFIWFGSAVMYMAVNRICGVIWLLGEDRQLLPWERTSTPLIMSSSLVSIDAPPSPRSAGGSSSDWDEESSYGTDDKSPQSSFRTQNSSDPYPWEKQQDLAYTDATSAASRPPSYYSKQSETRSLVPESAVSLQIVFQAILAGRNLS